MRRSLGVMTCLVQVGVLLVALPITIILLIFLGLPGLAIGILLWLVLIPIGFVLGMGFDLSFQAVALVVRFLLWILRLPIVALRWLTYRDRVDTVWEISREF